MVSLHFTLTFTRLTMNSMMSLLALGEAGTKLESASTVKNSNCIQVKSDEGKCIHKYHMHMLFFFRNKTWYQLAEEKYYTQRHTHTHTQLISTFILE